jgi:hypothetical protein
VESYVAIHPLSVLVSKPFRPCQDLQSLHEIFHINWMGQNPDLIDHTGPRFTKQGASLKVFKTEIEKILKNLHHFDHSQDSLLFAASFILVKISVAQSYR